MERRSTLVILDATRRLCSTTLGGTAPELADPRRTYTSANPPLFISRVDHHGRAEFMLDVIGAGPTVTSTIDWHDVWKKSPEATTTAQEPERIHQEGRNRPIVTTKRHTEHSSTWFHQTSVVTQRGTAAIWCDPVYVVAKFVLNIVAGLFVGFTCWKSPSTMQGICDRLFSIFVTPILSVRGGLHSIPLNNCSITTVLAVLG